MLLKNAHVVDPSVELDGRVDVLVERRQDRRCRREPRPRGAEVVDLYRQVPRSGLVDMHVHLREPGFEAKGDIESRPPLPPRAASPACAPCPTPTPSPTTASWSSTSSPSPPPRATAACTPPAP
ncbi:MAG: hypothetical protein ACLTSX_14675 [Collinsella sp.]